MPARLRKPSLGEAAMHGGWSLFVESFKRYFFSKRSVVLSLLFLVPSALIVLIRSVDDSPNVGTLQWFRSVETGILLNFAPTVLLSFACLLNAVGLIQDEIEEQTLTYLLLRPTPRWMIYLSKYLAATLTTVLLACFFHTVGFLCLYLGTDHLGDVLSTNLPKSMAAVALAAVAYSAVFGMIGLLLKRSLIVGVLYIVIFEGVLAMIPFNFRSYTIIYYFRVLSIDWVGVDPNFWGMTPTASQPLPAASHCVLVLILTAAVFALLGAYYVQRKEFRMKTPAGA
jgi:ABC-2 type transport system permease protein